MLYYKTVFYESNKHSVSHLQCPGPVHYVRLIGLANNQAAFKQSNQMLVIDQHAATLDTWIIPTSMELKKEISFEKKVHNFLP
jgi:hypothetical protein